MSNSYSPTGHIVSATGHIVSGLLNATASVINGHLSRVQQERLSGKNHALQVRLEENRQSFQLEQGRRNAVLQRELSLKNHELRLTEQQVNFENLCKQAEWSHFLQKWPLMNLPSVIRAEQVLPDGTVSLRVFFARSSDPVFTQAVYPRVEQGLCEFVDLYRNEFQSKNIVFYHNGFSSKVSGGAVISNIHYALCELPVVIIDSDVFPDEICVSLHMWGFGSAEKSHFTVFKLPYESHIVNGSFSSKYYSELADHLLAYLKFILGYAYDAYNLIEYNRPPLLPRIARYEAKLGGRGCLLDEPEVEKAICVKYEEIYSMVLGDGTPDGSQSFTLLPNNFKGCILHSLRIEYAEAMREYLTEEQFLRYLDDSVKAWAALRSSKSAENFLRLLADGGKYISDYIDRDDQQYLKTLSALYERVQLKNCFGTLVKRISDLLEEAEKYYQKGKEAAKEKAYEDAISWYRKAAEQGHGGAESRIGDFYEKGWGVKKDYKLAFQWYRKAAKHGYIKATRKLGDYYAKGSGVKQDYKEALKWYRKAADHGSATAALRLGDFYAKGDGVEKDVKQAADWYLKATAPGGYSVARSEALNKLKNLGISL